MKSINSLAQDGFTALSQHVSYNKIFFKLKQEKKKKEKSHLFKSQTNKDELNYEQASTGRQAELRSSNTISHGQIKVTNNKHMVKTQMPSGQSV